ncbi:hypothetical protein [Klebsiella quasipneumoniae]|uniref:hypothetical protein n=1 Tax=Klebsiella quasipneumoniae TaxID=1463165 RepID=UPI00190DC7C8|nr:hypothetical protein [Klebsiella quasipneumoniae]MBK2828463.1 hypothetical protein [Klebsiella quasipneumoniae]
MNIETVYELIASLDSAGELSIREQKFLKLAKAFKQLAAENVALKAAFHPSDIPSEWTDVFGDTAVIEHDAAGDNQGHSISWSWVDNQEEVIKSVLLAVDKGIETPATDRIVAGIKADGVEEFAAYKRAITEEWACKEGHSSLLKVAESAELFAKQLREGADK